MSIRKRRAIVLVVATSRLLRNRDERVVRTVCVPNPQWKEQLPQSYDSSDVADTQVAAPQYLPELLNEYRNKVRYIAGKTIAIGMQVESGILSLLSENGLGIPLYCRSIVRTQRWSGPPAAGFLVVWIYLA